MNKTISFVSYFGYFVIQNSMFKKPRFYVILGTFYVGNDFLISQTPPIKHRFWGGSPLFHENKGVRIGIPVFGFGNFAGTD
jgi:hypothetical protein